jgi:glycosyltransferase involved in cell wall biosynthesis
MVDSRSKILHVITGLGQGGAEATLFRVVSNTTDQFEHTVVSLSCEDYYAEKLNTLGVKVHLVRISGVFPIFQFIKLCWIILITKPILVQTWLYKADIFGGIAAKLMLKKVVWNLRSGLLNPTASISANLMLRLCGILSHFVPDSIIACAYSIVDYHSKFLYKVEKVVVIQNGLDFERFSFSFAGRKFFRSKWSISESDLVLGFVARFHSQKDHLTLLKAYKIVAARVLNLKLVLVGNGLSNSNLALIEWLNELGILENVILAGPEDNIPGVMSALDIHVSSSVFGEAFPNVILESMACGTIAVSTDVGDARFIISDSKFVCMPQDPDLLAGAISDCINYWRLEKDKMLREDVKRKVENFSIENTCKKYADLWNSFSNQDDK